MPRCSQIRTLKWRLVFPYYVALQPPQPNRDLYKASLDVDALFTNIPLDETIDICVKKLFKNPDTLVKGISKNYF